MQGKGTRRGKGVTLNMIDGKKTAGEFIASPGFFVETVTLTVDSFQVDSQVSKSFHGEDTISFSGHGNAFSGLW